MADKIFETSENNSIQGINSSSKPNNDFVNMICDLKDKIEVLNKDFRKSKTRNRSITPNRNQTPKRSNDSNKNICWYHKTFKHKAKKCSTPPCDFLKKKSKN